MIVKTIRLPDGPKSNSGTREAVRLLLGFFKTRFSSTELWCNHERLDTSIHTAILECWPNTERFKFPDQQGLSAAETSGLTSSEFASVLATSGTTGAEGESIGNSRRCAHLAEAFSTQWGDDALAARGAKARKSEAVAAAVGNFDSSGLSEAASRIENAISWNDAHQLINEYENDDDGFYEEDVDWYTVDCVMTSWMKQHTQLVLRQMTQNFLNRLMAFWKTLMRPHFKCMHQQVAVFKKRVSFCLVSKVPEDTFLLLTLVLLTAWLSHPLIACQQSLVTEARRARGKGNSLRRKVESRQTLVHLASCQNHRLPVPSLLRCPRSVRLKLAQLVVGHITFLVFVLFSACCVDMLDIVHQNVPTKEKRLHFTWQTGIWYPCCGLQCSMLRVVVQLSTEPKKIKTRMTSKILLCSTKSLEGFVILDGGATTIVSGFMSIQPVADQYEDTTIETTGVGFTAKRKRQARTSCYYMLSFRKESR